jgi:coenzyme F420-reducing hydrogenase gamma subunit
LPFIAKALLCSGIVTAASACLSNEDSAAGGQAATSQIRHCGLRMHVLEIRNPKSAIRNFKPAPEKPHESR